MKNWMIVVVAVLPLIACSAETEEQSAPTQEQNNDYSPQGWTAKSLPEIAEGIRNGEVSAEQLTQAYLDRIEAIDRNGPRLQSVLTINPNALEDARALDAKRNAGEALGPLHGVPILIKDNIETQDPMATTAGALALKDNVTGRDSPLVAGLRDAGAVILGKTNLSQWANFRSEDSMSGWSALGGQVRNPHMLDRNPCGSSSGSGAAMAASLAAGTVGTETNGSIICPSNANGIVGFKPTVGLVPQQYIIPISASQDTAGPMTKTVKGAAMMLNAMASGEAKVDYVAALDENSLQGIRVGVLRYSVGNNKDIIEKFNAAIKILEEGGATLVEIEIRPETPKDFGKLSYDVLKYEFKAGLNDYLSDTPDSVSTRSLDDLIAFNNEHADVELPLFDQSIFDASAGLAGLDDPAYINARDTVQKATRADGIDALMAAYNVDVLVAPSGIVQTRIDPINGDVWTPFPGAGGLAAIGGYPHLTVPMGTVHKVPVGFSFIASKDQDAKVLSFGYAFEQRAQLRPEPTYLDNAEVLEEVAKPMRRRE